MEGGGSAPPPVTGGFGGGAAGGGAGSLTFPGTFVRQQHAPPVGGGFGAPDESAMVDSLVSQFSEINTAFDPEATLRRFVEVTNLPPDEARGLLTAHGGDLRASIAQFVATQARSTASNFEVADDSDESDESDSDDEPKIRPVYRTTSGRGIRMRAADRAAALRKLGSAAGGASAIGKDRRPVRPPVARKIPQAVGARFYNDYGETLQLFWDAPGPNPRGAFLQGSILPGATLRMKSYVGHAFHAELAGEMVWGQKLNDKTRQWYTIDRSQKQETTQDLFAGWSLTEDKPAAGGGAAPPPIGGDGGIGPAADMDDEML